MHRALFKKSKPHQITKSNVLIYLDFTSSLRKKQAHNAGIMQKIYSLKTYIFVEKLWDI
jgi:hypothetical protein